jgi:NDP-sugar pyrophosphorylase family protein
MPLTPLIEGHFALQSEVTLALRSKGPLLNVNIDQDGYVCDMRHILKNPGIRSCLFAGIYIIEKKFLRRLEAGRVESVVPPLIAMIKENPRSVGGMVIDDGYWYDLGSIEEYEKVNKLFKVNL